MANRGGRSLWYGEYIGHVNLGSKSARVYADREATLDERLEVFESRYLRYLKLVFNEDRADEVQITLKRDDAASLADLLVKAVKEVEGDDTL